ncbi:hypothetical protein AFL01nite_09980 [Aeromicrobium flavum]|uniref:Mannitol dehydrogenase C-terminal domain-containing protein n=1 Tax=Aeromicrobium flavum TaxID=416568 RepID=A0A512HT86_9ACTN|nr:hypothetical protein [Aeromicrobium flavum]GEO88671.1 hypothetical protein AFL01nite_09980 [Aeromicrobium flavum]
MSLSVPPIEPDDGPAQRAVRTHLLSVGHTALGFLGILAGHATTSETLEDPVFREYLRVLLEQEVAPRWPSLPAADPAAHRAAIVRRLSRLGTAEELARLCLDGERNVARYLVPSVHEAMRAGRRHELSTLAVAAWLVLESRSRGVPSPLVIRDGEIYGTLATDALFLANTRAAVTALRRHGARRALQIHLTSREAAPDVPR